jgi:hypothetical protein
VKNFKKIWLWLVVAFALVDSADAGCREWLRRLSAPTFAGYSSEQWKTFYDEAKASTDFNRGSLALVELILLKKNELPFNLKQRQILEDLRNSLELKRNSGNPNFKRSFLTQSVVDLAWAMGPFFFRRLELKSFVARQPEIQKILEFLTGENSSEILQTLGIERDPFYDESVRLTFGEPKDLSNYLSWINRLDVLRPALLATMLTLGGIHPVDHLFVRAKIEEAKPYVVSRLDFAMDDYLEFVNLQTHIFSDNPNPTPEESVSFFVDKDMILGAGRSLAEEFLETDAIKGIKEINYITTKYPNVTAKSFGSPEELNHLIQTNAGKRATIVMLHGSGQHHGTMVISTNGIPWKAEDVPTGVITNPSILMIISCNGGFKPSRQTRDQDENWIRIANRLSTNKNLQVYAPVNLVSFSREWKRDLTEDEKKTVEIRWLERQLEDLDQMERSLNQVKRQSAFILPLAIFFKGMGAEQAATLVSLYRSLKNPSVSMTPGIRIYDQSKDVVSFAPIYPSLSKQLRELGTKPILPFPEFGPPTKP